MIVIELSEDRFGKAMKNITCIEDKLKEIKEVFEDEAMDYRRQEPQYEDPYYRRDRYQRNHTKEYNRYM